jgi:hypothetical protein
MDQSGKGYGQTNDGSGWESMISKEKNKVSEGCSWFCERWEEVIPQFLTLPALSAGYLPPYDKPQSNATNVSRKQQIPQIPYDLAVL